MNWGKLVCVHLHFVYCLFKDDDTSQRLWKEEEGEKKKTLKRCSFSEAHKHSRGRYRLASVSLWNVLKYLDEEQRKKETCSGWIAKVTEVKRVGWLAYAGWIKWTDSLPSQRAFQTALATLSGTTAAFQHSQDHSSNDGCQMWQTCNFQHDANGPDVFHCDWKHCKLLQRHLIDKSTVNKVIVVEQKTHQPTVHSQNIYSRTTLVLLFSLNHLLTFEFAWHILKKKHKKTETFFCAYKSQASGTFWPAH